MVEEKKQLCGAELGLHFVSFNKESQSFVRISEEHKCIVEHGSPEVTHECICGFKWLPPWYTELIEKYPSKGWYKQDIYKQRRSRPICKPWDFPFETHDDIDMSDVVVTQSDGVTEIKFEARDRRIKLLEEPINPLIYVYYNKLKQDFNDIRWPGKLDGNGDAHTPSDIGWIEDWEYRPAH